MTKENKKKDTKEKVKKITKKATKEITKKTTKKNVEDKITKNSKEEVKKTKKKLSWWKKTLIVIAILILLLVIFTISYINDYYKADIDAINAFSTTTDVEVTQLSEDITIYGSKENEIGIIFYPGAKIEYNAYEPLLKNIASYGITTVNVKMPGNLAFFDPNAATTVRNKLPEIKNWYIAGHSLGGSIAAVHIENNKDIYKGMILLGSYTTSDLTNENIDVLSLIGTEDKITSIETYNKFNKNLPSSAKKILIEGGNHAYYGMYGEQEGDGIAKISVLEQIDFATNEIVNFIFDNQE